MWRGAWRLDLGDATQIPVGELLRAEVTTGKDTAGVIVHAVFGAIARVWAGSLNRLRYSGVTMTLASTKTMRRALECKDYSKGAARFTGPTPQALRVARALDWDGTTPWRKMWAAGWAAAWPPAVRGYWWTLTSGTRYFAVQRRAYDRDNAGCVLCSVDGGSFTPMDTILHMTQCPAYSALWRSVVDVLAVGGMAILPANVLRFALYGQGATRAADVHTLVRGSIIAALQHVRGTSLAAAINGQHAHRNPQDAVDVFRAAMRRHIELDYCIPTIRDPRTTCTGPPCDLLPALPLPSSGGGSCDCDGVVLHAHTRPCTPCANPAMHPTANPALPLLCRQHPCGRAGEPHRTRRWEGGGASTFNDPRIRQADPRKSAVTARCQRISPPSTTYPLPSRS